MNDKEFGSLNLLKLKYRRGEQIIQTFCKSGSNQKLRPRSLFCRNSKALRKVLLNRVERIEIYRMMKKFGSSNFKIEIKKRRPNNLELMINYFLQETTSLLLNL